MKKEDVIQKLKQFELEYKDEGDYIIIENPENVLSVNNNIVFPNENNLHGFCNYKIFEEEHENVEVSYLQCLFLNPYVSFTTKNCEDMGISLTLSNIKNKEIQSMCFDILNRKLPHGILIDYIKERYLNV